MVEYAIRSAREEGGGAKSGDGDGQGGGQDGVGLDRKGVGPKGLLRVGRIGGQPLIQPRSSQLMKGAGEAGGTGYLPGDFLGGAGQAEADGEGGGGRAVQGEVVEIEDDGGEG